MTLSIGLILALLIALEEFSQKFFSTRSFDFIDLLASYAGIVTFAIPGSLLEKTPLVVQVTNDT